MSMCILAASRMRLSYSFRKRHRASAVHFHVAFPCARAKSVPLFGFAPNGTFGLGAALVVASIFLYAWTPKPTAGVSNYVPVASGEPRQGSPSKV